MSVCVLVIFLLRYIHGPCYKSFVLLTCPAQITHGFPYNDVGKELQPEVINVDSATGFLLLASQESLYRCHIFYDYSNTRM